MKKFKSLALIFISVVCVIAFVGCDWFGGDDKHKPTVVLSPNTITVNNSNLSRIVEISGTATGIVTLDASALPAGVTATVDGAIVTVTGVRPDTNVPAITGGFIVVVTREGITQNLTVNVNLTTTYVPYTPTVPSNFDITPVFQTVARGAVAQSLVLSVGAGTTPFTYQWQRSANGGVDWIDIADSNSSTIAPSTETIGTFQYSVTVSNSVGSVSGGTVVVVVQETVNPPSSVTVAPTSQTVNQGGTPNNLFTSVV